MLYLATGLWPIVHYRSFERVTGPKRDDWLVKTTGGLIAAIGATLWTSARDPGAARTTNVLAATSATALAAADIVFVVRRRISPIYLVDAAVELALAWLAVARLRQAARSAAIPSSSFASASTRSNQR